MKSYLKQSLIASLTSVIVFSACNNGDDDNRRIYGAYASTQTRTLPTSNRILKCDGGDIVEITKNSEIDIVGTATRLDTVKRVLFYCYFTPENEQVDAEGHHTIMDAQLAALYSLPIKKIFDRSTNGADTTIVRNALNPDSLFEVSSISDLWADNGYMTLLFNGTYYNGINPSIVMVLDSIRGKEANFTLCYNRRSLSAQYITDFAISYPMDNIRNAFLEEAGNTITGRDSVILNVNFYKKNPISRKVPFRSLYE